MDVVMNLYSGYGVTEPIWAEQGPTQGMIVSQGKAVSR
jgi:hypothetical protein